jgi:tRNA U38,U39,U40 pseudouridine synthase TruA
VRRKKKALRRIVKVIENENAVAERGLEHSQKEMVEKVYDGHESNDEEKDEDDEEGSSEKNHEFPELAKMKRKRESEIQEEIINDNDNSNEENDNKNGDANKGEIQQKYDSFNENAESTLSREQAEDMLKDLGIPKFPFTAENLSTSGKSSNFESSSSPSLLTARLNGILSLFKGTHNYHNYTVMKGRESWNYCHRIIKDIYVWILLKNYEFNVLSGK